MRDERVRRGEETKEEDEATEETVTEDSLLYVKSLPPTTVAALHRSISLYVMPDLLPGLRNEYGTRAPSPSPTPSSYLEVEMGVRVGVMLLRFPFV
jgi:hypothetical protein